LVELIEKHQAFSTQLKLLGKNKSYAQTNISRKFKKCQNDKITLLLPITDEIPSKDGFHFGSRTVFLQALGIRTNLKFAFIPTWFPIKEKSLYKKRIAPYCFRKSSLASAFNCFSIQNRTYAIERLV